MIIAPGFIDLHSHSDYPLQDSATRPNLNFLLQGVTTVVTGNCGMGPVDVADYYGKLKERGIGTNVAHQIPHNDVRRRAMGNADRPPSASELKRMEEFVEKGMKDGAWGLATGLIYNPGTYAKTDEIIALAKVAGRHGGFYASHIRNEGVNILVATDEAITIGREAGLPVHISHMKASGQKAWGMAADQMALVRKARKEGRIVTGDQYPYIASSTSLSATVIPARFREGSREDFLARLDDAEVGPRLKQAISDSLDERGGGKTVRIASYSPKREWQGKSIADVAKEVKKTPLEVVIEIERNGGASIVNFGMSEEDVRLIMKNDFVATASDGSAQVPGETVPHPRSYGTFPRKIGRYALEEGVVTLEQAIRSASGLPADVLHIKDRGYIKEGYAADVVVFDPKSYRDRATFDRPHQYASGVIHLYVNGRHVIDRGRFTGTLAGIPLVRQEHERPASWKRGTQPVGKE
jgi:N-acyl-D-aspartate/D-glutamate deacylase